MSLNIAKGQRVNVWKIEDKGGYSIVSISSSRKDKRDDTWKNSNWSYVKFVGAAHEKASELKEKDRIELHGATVSREEYTDANGERAWPKSPQITVFNWEFYTPDDTGAKNLDKAPAVEPEDNEDVPF
jgi:hypothetical protein